MFAKPRFAMGGRTAVRMHCTAGGREKQAMDSGRRQAISPAIHHPETPHTMVEPM